MKLSFYCEIAATWVTAAKVQYYRTGRIVFNGITTTSLEEYKWLARDDLLKYIGEEGSILEMDVTIDQAFKILGV